MSGFFSGGNLIAVGSLLASGVVLIGVSYLPQFRSTKLTVSPLVVDHGEVGEAPVSGEFKLINTGPKKITIRAVKKSCSCQEISIPSSLEPYSSQSVAYNWPLAGANGYVQAGYIFYYDVDGIQSKMGTMTVKLKADVKPDFVLSKDAIDFYLGASLSNRVNLIPVAQADVKLLAVESLHPAIVTRIIDDRTFDVFESQGSKLPVHDQNATIVVRTNSIHRPADMLDVYFHKLPFESEEISK